MFATPDVAAAEDLASAFAATARASDRPPYTYSGSSTYRANGYYYTY